MNKVNDALRAMFTVGTPQCGVTGAVIGVIIAVLLLTIGFWKTLFILLCALVGAFTGLVKNKKDALRGVINRGFPAKDEITVDTYEDLKNK